MLTGKNCFDKHIEAHRNLGILIKKSGACAKICTNVPLKTVTQK